MSRRHAGRSDAAFKDLLAALTERDETGNADFARLDYERQRRTGSPEILLASGKQDEQVIDLIARMLDRSGRALVSRVRPDLADTIQRSFAGCLVEHHAKAAMVRISNRDSCVERSGGSIAIFTAGTSDLPLASEAALVADEMGCDARIIADVGVAGLHRVIRPLKQALDDGVDVFIVVAGMDGALPSVISGLSPVPVIGLPSSVGYGFGGNGEAALMSMLQTCSPGLTVVNIDNSVGAGISAATIANAIAAARAGTQ